MIPSWWFYYASPSSREACRDRQLTINFELWVEIFCVPTCFHVRILKQCLSVPEKRNHHSFVNICPTLVANWDINGKVFTSTTAWKLKNVILFSKKFIFWLVTKSWNHLSFVNISPTLVIDTSMKWSSRVLLQIYNMKTQKFEFFLNFEIRFWLNFIRVVYYPVVQGKKFLL